MSRWLGALLMILLCSGCAKDKCADGGCDTDSSDPEYDVGGSRMLSLNTADGEILWGKYFAGEAVTIDGLANDDTQVVVSLDDPCWTEGRTFAFDVEDGSEESVGPVTPPAQSTICTPYVTEELPVLYNAGGVCVGESTIDAGTLVAIDTLNGSELWRNPIEMDSFVVVDDLLLIQSTVPASGEHRITRLTPATGQTLWLHQQEEAMIPIGADDSALFMLDNVPFALTASSGDVAWETDLGEDDDWSFEVPELGSGVMLDGHLFVVRQEIPASPCVDTATP